MSELRTEIGLAIVKAFAEDVRAGEPGPQSFDPDTCYRAADEVIALLVSRLTGDRFEARFHPRDVEHPSFSRVVKHLWDAEEALRGVHQYQCGCDSPGTLGVCVAQPIVLFAVLNECDFAEIAS